mmetsp:Transcript_23732/g.62543  ORF Transcript_23732/g.62543 Transcript_23732/m.62543 type:complete len:612 (-) Transcript_23732:229-2064(-)
MTNSRSAGLATAQDPGSSGDHGNSQVSLTCAFGKNVTISSHRFQNLQDKSGVPNLSGGRLTSEQWTLADAGGGYVRITSIHGRHLADEDGAPALVAEAGENTKWRVHAARHGLVHFESYREAKLGDWEGALQLDETYGDSQEWFIAGLDGVMACTDSQANCGAGCQELAHVRRRLVEAQKALFRAQSVHCPTSVWTTPPPRPNVGRCAVFGDPHFITFDGGHTTYVGDRIIWLVRSQDVWIQAVSRDSTGNFVGMAISGPFMKDHKLIVYNMTDGGPLRVTYDGKRVLNGAEEDEVDIPNTVHGWRKRDWNGSMHDSKILELRTEMKFDIGPFPERFLGSPEGGLFLFRFPGYVEITITGVDFMSAVITMPPQDSQSGYCGNFNGEANDDFSAVVPSWNTPIGEGLDAVAESENLFQDSEILGLLASDAKIHKSKPRTLRSMAKRVELCQSPDFKAQAEQACAHVSDQRMHADCVFDICETGDLAAAQGTLAAEIMQLKVNPRASVSFIGAGNCQDSDGHRYSTWQTEDVRTEADCMKLLQDLALTQGVVGAELKRTSTCQVLVEAGVDLSGNAAIAQWKQGGPLAENGEKGSGLITGSTDDPAWSCWATI